MGRGFYDRLSAILLAHRCHFVRQGKGSHEIWFSPLSQKRFSVPVTIIAKPTANGILRQAGIDQRLGCHDSALTLTWQRMPMRSCASMAAAPVEANRPS